MAQACKGEQNSSVGLHGIDLTVWSQTIVCAIVLPNVMHGSVNARGRRFQLRLTQPCLLTVRSMAANMKTNQVARCGSADSLRLGLGHWCLLRSERAPRCSSFSRRLLDLHCSRSKMRPELPLQMTLARSFRRLTERHRCESPFTDFVASSTHVCASEQCTIPWFRIGVRMCLVWIVQSWHPQCTNRVVRCCARGGARAQHGRGALTD